MELPVVWLSFVPVLAAVAVAGLIVAWLAFRRMIHKNAVTAHLGIQGNHVLSIRRTFFRRGYFFELRQTQYPKYLVEYLDPNGRRHRTVCQVTLSAVYCVDDETLP